MSDADPEPRGEVSAANDNAPLTLRPYQVEAIDAVAAQFRAGRKRTLIVLGTGLGKTVIAAEWFRRAIGQGGRTLFLAQRTELLDQAHQKLASAGVVAQVEQGGRRATDAACVLGSVQTMRGARLERWAPDAFTDIVLDEAHHGPASGCMAILGRFASARLLGMTATPDRLDGRGLGEVFESVAFRFEMREGIRAGWLAPIRARRVAVDGLDLAGVHTRAGDLDRAELAGLMAEEAALHGVAAPLLELAGSRPTVVFAVDVAHAHALAAVLNRYEPDVARAVDGSMRADERKRILADFTARRFRVLVNVALLTEGWDCPAVACVAMARPTKSRALYSQCVGRGTRLSPGKEDLLVLDFSGMAGRHRLIGPADVLAGREVDDDVRAEMAAILEAHPQAGQADLDALLDAVEATAIERRAQATVTAIARYRAEVIDPFAGEMPEAPRAPWAGDLATEKQLAALINAGLPELPSGLTKGEASTWLDAIARRRDAGLATVKQLRRLRRYGIDAKAMTVREASSALDDIQANGWRKGWAA